MFAQIDNGVVTAILYSDAMPPEDTWPEGRSFVATDDAAVLGGTYDGETFTPPAPVVAPKQISKVDFLRLIQPTEFAAMQNAAKNGDVMMMYGLEILSSARYIDPADPLLAQLVGYAVSQNILSPERRDAITAGLAAL